ncbi:MAG: right-handed parallel beta-helix repeat-containing protein [Candidatus Krumholzibacteriia bacterium]|nr:right-handed parallel beta-helix repeat-containing protein [bacterium]
MTRRLAGLALTLFLVAPLLLAGCSEKDNTAPESTSRVLSVPGSYATLAAAVAAANAGDKIVVTYRTTAYNADVTLPAGVQLWGHNENPKLPEFLGQLRVVGSGAEVSLRDFALSNPDGAGIVLTDSDCTLQGLWIKDCDGPGIALLGDSHATVSECDIQRCLPGVLIRDTSVGGHYADADHPSVRIGSCDFLENSDGSALSNIVFANIAALYTISVKFNYWGAAGMDVPAIDATITDNKDASSLLGLADTDADDFTWAPAPWDHWWQD